MSPNDSAMPARRKLPVPLPPALRYGRIIRLSDRRELYGLVVKALPSGSASDGITADPGPAGLPCSVAAGADERTSVLAVAGTCSGVPRGASMSWISYL